MRRRILQIDCSWRRLSFRGIIISAWREGGEKGGEREREGEGKGGEREGGGGEREEEEGGRGRGLAPLRHDGGPDDVTMSVHKGSAEIVDTRPNRRPRRT